MHSYRFHIIRGVFPEFTFWNGSVEFKTIFKIDFKMYLALFDFVERKLQLVWQVSFYQVDMTATHLRDYNHKKFSEIK